MPPPRIKESEHWFEEGSYAYKAGIALPELKRHYPEDEMTFSEWCSLEGGWFNMRKRSWERMGQKSLFD